MRTKIIGIIFTGLLLVAGACAPSSKNPQTAIIKIQLVGTDQTPYWRPSTAAVAVGGTVTWQNTSADTRNVISDDGLFNKTLPPGQSFSYIFKQAGTFTFHDDPNIETDTIIAN